MDLAIRTGISLQVPAASVASSSSSSSSTPVTPVTSINEKNALAATEANTMSAEADQESTAQVSNKEPLAQSALSKGQRKRRRNIEKAMQKRIQSYLSKLSQSMIRRTIKDLKVADTTRLSKVNALLGVDLAPDRAMECRRKLLRGCKTNPEFIHDVTKELDRMIDSANGDESMDSKDRRRKVKVFKNLAGYHDLIVKSLKADQQLSEEGVQTASAPVLRQQSNEPLVLRH
ncbi:hypothetical protein BGZ68_008178 [Mortierella alpina]|nr:hypothetical protein BGZ68_008178 [Mortierella alpina]